MSTKRTERWIAWAAGAAAMVGVGIVWWLRPDGISFRAMGPTEVAPLLTPVFVTAAFMERAVEVFVSVWRGETATELAFARDAASESQRAGAEHALAAYKCESQRLAFKGAFIGGLVLAIAGVRGLTPFLASDAHPSWLFTACDVVLTALVLSGGAEGIHRFVSVITEFLDSTRGRIQSAQTDSR